MTTVGTLAIASTTAGTTSVTMSMTGGTGSLIASITMAGTLSTGGGGGDAPISIESRSRSPPDDSGGRWSWTGAEADGAVGSENPSNDSTSRPSVGPTA